MVRTTTRLISGGRVTISQPIRDALELREGDLVEIEIQTIDQEKPA